MKFVALLAPAAIVAAVVFSGQTHSSSLCHLGIRADRVCTPGSIFPITAKQVCVPGYSAQARDVPFSRKQDVYSEYGVTHRTPFGSPGSYEIDHLIPLELGGDNQVSNLWPEAYPGYEGKDHDENRLHASVCAGEMKLSSAQAFMRRHYRTR